MRLHGFAGKKQAWILWRNVGREFSMIWNSDWNWREKSEKWVKKTGVYGLMLEKMKKEKEIVYIVYKTKIETWKN